MRQYEITIRRTSGEVLRRFEAFASSQSGAMRRAHEAAEDLEPGTSWVADAEAI